ncbi:MAG: hypothetical protein WAN35_06265 [Terracidiphilus sp.]
MNCSNGLRQTNSQFWGRIFGAAIQQNREKRGHSVAEAVRLAGMEPSAWLAIEAGCVPDPKAAASDLRRAWPSLRQDSHVGLSLPGRLGTVTPTCRRPGA